MNTNNYNKIGDKYFYGTNKNYDEAYKYYYKGLCKNDKYSIYMIGKICQKRNQIQKAIGYFIKSADLGYNLSYNKLGIIYLNLTIPKYKLAIYYFKKGIDNNIGSCYYNLGNMYEKGKGVKQNIRKAYELYSEGVINGSKYSSNKLLFDNNIINKIQTINKTDNDTEDKYLKIDKYREIYIKTMNDYNKINIDMDTCKENINLLKEIEHYGSVYVYNLIGCYYILLKEYDLAKEYYMKGINKGLPIIYDNIGYIYENNDYQYKDIKKALYYYDLAYKNNNENLKIKYLYNKYKKSNDGNDIYNLGIMYENGYYVKQDIKKAYELYEKSINMGCIEAKNKLLG